MQGAGWRRQQMVSELEWASLKSLQGQLWMLTDLPCTRCGLYQPVGCLPAAKSWWKGYAVGRELPSDSWLLPTHSPSCQSACTSCRSTRRLVMVLSWMLGLNLLSSEGSKVQPDCLGRLQNFYCCSFYGKSWTTVHQECHRNSLFSSGTVSWTG